MRLLCLCPTYGRPTLLANMLACFLAQDYPPQRRKLVILDDAGQYRSQQGAGWSLVSVGERFSSLPAKYHAMLELENVWQSSAWDAVMPWDDDDIYLPHHISSHAAVLAKHGWSYPEHVWSLYTGRPELEATGGRFWASCAARVDLLRRIGGVPQTREADFDQRFLGRLSEQEPPGRPAGSPAFIFRWGSTHAPHAQYFIGPGQDTTWYDRMPRHETHFVEQLVPRFDAETAELLAWHEREGRKLAELV